MRLEIMNFTKVIAGQHWTEIATPLTWNNN